MKAKREFHQHPLSWNEYLTMDNSSIEEALSVKELENEVVETIDIIDDNEKLI